MEAMVAATTAALTIYDMLKSIDRFMSVGPTRLLEKSGGRSGHLRAPDDGKSVETSSASAKATSAVSGPTGETSFGKDEAR